MIFMNAFFNSQFNYCSLVMSQPILSSKINKLHERCLRLICTDNTSTLQEFFDKDNLVSTHLKNMQSLAIELYEEANNISTEIIKEVFNFCGERGYDLKQQNIYR